MVLQVAVLERMAKVRVDKVAKAVAVGMAVPACKSLAEP